MAFADCGGLATINWGSSGYDYRRHGVCTHGVYEYYNPKQRDGYIWTLHFGGCESLSTAELGFCSAKLGYGCICGMQRVYGY